MNEEEKIRDIEERITLTGMLPGVNLSYLPPEESAKLKRAALDLYRLGHASGFMAGVDHAIATGASVMTTLRDALRTHWMMRWLSARMRERRREFVKSLRSIRARVIGGRRPPRFPTETLSGNWAIRR